MKFYRDRKVEFKKSFELCRQIWLKVLTKVGINFIDLASKKIFQLRLKVLNGPLKKIFSVHIQGTLIEGESPVRMTSSSS